MSKNKRVRSRTSLTQVKKKAVRIFVCVGLISTLALVGYGAWTARHILEPISTFASAESTTETTASQQIKFYTLFIDEHEYVTSASFSTIDTHEQTLKSIVLPESTLLHLPYGMDEFKLGSLYKVTGLENRDNRNKLITQTLIEYFGLPSQTTFIVKQKNPQHFNEWLTNPSTLFHLMFDSAWTRGTLITSQSAWEVIQLAKTLHAIPSEFITTINIEEYGIGAKTKNKDGSEVIITDRNKLDEYIKKSFQNIDLMQEKLNVKIENSTEISGLGSKFGRIVTNMGGVVIDIGNTGTKTEKNIIAIRDDSISATNTFQELIKSIQEYEVKTVPHLSSGADITVTLGNAYATQIHGKVQ